MMDKKYPYELPLCPKCNVHRRYRKAWRKDGVTPIFHSKCDFCRGASIRRNKNRSRNRYYEKKNYCEKCGFIAEHSCQLDVDHKDGNNRHNNNSNLQTLCANCHRLKTFLNKDWEPTKQGEEVEF